MSSKPRQHYLCVSPYHATADALDVDAQEYLQRHSIQGLLDDAVTLLLESGEKGQQKQLEFLHDYFRHVLRGTHVAYREYQFVNSCPLNRASFVQHFLQSYSSIPAGESVTVTDMHQLALLQCKDFPLDAVARAFHTCAPAMAADAAESAGGGSHRAPAASSSAAASSSGGGVSRPGSAVGSNGAIPFNAVDPRVGFGPFCRYLSFCWFFSEYLSVVEHGLGMTPVAGAAGSDGKLPNSQTSLESMQAVWRQRGETRHSRSQLDYLFTATTSGQHSMSVVPAAVLTRVLKDMADAAEEEEEEEAGGSSNSTGAGKMAPRTYSFASFCVRAAAACATLNAYDPGVQASAFSGGAGDDDDDAAGSRQASPSDVVAVPATPNKSKGGKKGKKAGKGGKR